MSPLTPHQPTAQPNHRDLFTRHGIRCTRQRQALYDALLHTEQHPTADELFRDVSPAIDGISLATVYNTLEAFCDAGLAQKLTGAGSNGSARYDAKTHNHIHLRCVESGNVADAPQDLSQSILDHLPADTLKELERKLGFEIGEVHIELTGRFHNSDASGDECGGT